MTIFSRRQFLQLAGIALVGSQINLTGGFYPPSKTQLTPTPYGRALAAVPVYSNPASAVTNHLWPDSVVPIQNIQGDWYKISHGYVPKTALQPITLYEPEPHTIETPLFWAEVVGPVASVRRWCAADARLVSRIGHGGVAQVIDLLPGDSKNGDWYGIATENGDLLGWTQTVSWRRLVDENINSGQIHLEINQLEQQITIFDGESKVLQAPFSLGDPMTPGTYALRRGQMAATHASYHGAPWQVQFGDDYTLTGVYWHNQFGEAAPGAAVQVTPMLARWLYQRIGDNDFVTIV